MEEVFATCANDIGNYWQRAAWYRATTLTERIASLRGGTDNHYHHNELAKQRLQRWKEQPPFNWDSSYFAQRLATDLLTEDDLLTLLAESIEEVQARCELLPDWLTELQRAFEEYGSDDDPLPLPATTEKHVVSFLTTIKPLLRSGLIRLQQGIQHLSQVYSFLPFDTTTIIPLLFAQMQGLVWPRLSRTITLELNVARLQGRLQGETPEERFQYFLDQLTQPTGMLPLLEEYAVLARALVEMVERWVTYSLELLGRLCADWEEICAQFLPPENPGPLVEIQTGKGDMHRGGRTVAILRWQSGFCLVYKPRSLAIDVHFQELLAWLNASGYQPAFYTLKILDKQTHGWAEYVQHSPCSSPDEVERFYQRQGGYLALLYTLETGDFHAENLIACGEHPVLIDLETLLLSRAMLDESFWQENPGMETMERSVLRTNLLPQRVWSTDEREGIDISGLGGRTGQLTPKPIARWTEIGTDQMRVQKERVEIPLGSHRPRLQDQDVDPLAYCDSIIAGFTSAYRLILAHRDELQMHMLPRFAQDEIRCLLRPTQMYNVLIFDSFHPNQLRDALDRDRLVDRLWAGVSQRPYMSRVIAAERNDILAGDIPVFVTRPDSRDLFTAYGECIPEFLGKTALECINAHLQRFDEEDLERQIWVIKASFTSMTLGDEKGGRPLLRLHPPQTVASSDSFLTAAQAVGDRLSKLAVHSNDMVGWLGVTLLKEREWHLLPAAADIYSGTTGIALFLAYLGDLTGEKRYTELALLALRNGRYQVDQLKKESNVGNIGGFSGLGGYIYLLSHLGTLWHDPTLYREAEELVRLLPDAIAQDQMFDVLGGAAGCIAALLSLYTVAPSQETLAVAILCGEHLLATARPMNSGIGWSTKMEETPLAGFGHGNAGIALNLLRLAALSNEERFRQAARDAMEYERSLFSPIHNNWPDLRSDAIKDGQPSYMVAWCHGAPGIGLGRLASLPYMDDAAIRAEIETAMQTTITRGFGANHSLCHGDMGNAELPLIAAQVLDNPELQQTIKQITSMLLENVETQGWVSGIPMGVETPGLMTGLAGTGYALLRWAAPERVPSVLVLAPPIF